MKKPSKKSTFSARKENNVGQTNAIAKAGSVPDAIDELVVRSKEHPELRRFHRFHQQHPEVLSFLVSEIRLRIDKDFDAFSYHSLWEYCRWKLQLESGPGTTFLLNDHAAPYYARAITILYPEFNGLAEFRESTPDRVFGTRLEPLTPEHRKGARRRRLQWADGTPLELGWRPSAPHTAYAPTANRRPDIHTEGRA